MHYETNLMPSAISSALASKFVHRGMIQSENGVFQPTLNVGLPTESGDVIGLTANANMDLNDDNGDAWFPQGHGRRSAVASHFIRLFGSRERASLPSDEPQTAKTETNLTIFSILALRPKVA